MTRINNEAASVAPSQTASAGSVESFRDAMRPLNHPALNDAAWRGNNAGGAVTDVSRSVVNDATGGVRQPR
jgi:hypothetical protein